MRAGRFVLIAGLMLAAAAPAQAAWMTFVSRDVATGTRLGIGARVYNDDADPVLAIVCTPDGLTAMFDARVAMVDQPPTALLLAADGGDFDLFPVSVEPHRRGERMEMRLVLEQGEAMGLAEYVLGANETIRVGYRLDDAEVVSTFSNDSATISIGAVLGECEGRGKAKG